MQDMRSIIDVIGYRQLAELLDVSSGTVSSWRTRDMIPAEFWTEVAAECARLGHAEITCDRLAEIWRDKRRAPRAKPADDAVEAEAAR